MIFFSKMIFVLALVIPALAHAQSNEWNELNNQFWSLFGNGQYDQALIAAKKSLETAEKSQGKDHQDVAKSLDMLAVLYSAQGKGVQAELHAKRSLAILEKALGLGHPDLARSLDRLAVLYREQGQYAQAEELYKRSLAILENNFGPDHPNLVQSLHDLAILYRLQMQHYEQAESLLKRALTILDKNDSDQALAKMGLANNVQGSLAEMYLSRGEYVQAEPLLMRNLATQEKNLSPDHQNLATALSQLALLYQNQSRYAQAESHFMRSLAIREKAQGQEYTSVAWSLLDLARLYKAQDLHTQAEPLLKRSLAIIENALGSNHPHVAIIQNELAQLYLAQGLYAQAESLLKSTLEIQEKNSNSDLPGVAALLHNLEELYRVQGLYAQAEPLLKRKLAIWEKTFGPNHPNVAYGLISSSSDSLLRGDISEAVTQAQRAIAIREHHLALFLVRGTEEEKRNYMITIENDIPWAISLQLAADSGNLAARRLALTTVLQRKGRILDAISGDIASLRERLNEQDRALLDQLSAIRSQQSSLHNRAQQGNIPLEQYHDEMARLTVEAQILESKISNHSAEFKTKAQPITLAGIQQAIPKDTALVEFTLYRPFNPKIRVYGAARYIAYVLRPQGEPVSVELGEADDIDRRINKLRVALADPSGDRALILSRRLDEQLMQPIRKLLGETRTVFLSPDGAFNLLPFGTLIDENNEYLIKRYAFTYLSSGRDLLRLQAKVESKNQGAIFANVDFGEIDKSIKVIKDDSDARNRRSSGFVSGTFTPLRGTAMEADEISRILPGIKVLTGEEATEDALKNLDRPHILHIATHGFFLADQRENPHDAPGLQSLSGPAPSPISENPLLRSGLALANANQLVSAGEDGVLTALEASGLNLWGTQLVVLSACETGLGDVQNGEGVFGLRRALVIAGSESQVMSLWKVDDLATKDLMVDYYQRLTAKEGRSEALRQAQLAMLFKPDRQHPFYWASFIPSGDWRELD